MPHEFDHVPPAQPEKPRPTPGEIIPPRLNTSEKSPRGKMSAQEVGEHATRLLTQLAEEGKLPERLTMQWFKENLKIGGLDTILRRDAPAHMSREEYFRTLLPRRFLPLMDMYAVHRRRLISQAVELLETQYKEGDKVNQRWFRDRDDRIHNREFKTFASFDDFVEHLPLKWRKIIHPEEYKESKDTSRLTEHVMALWAERRKLLSRSRRTRITNERLVQIDEELDTLLRENPDHVQNILSIIQETEEEPIPSHEEPLPAEEEIVDKKPVESEIPTPPVVSAAPETEPRPLSALAINNLAQMGNIHELPPHRVPLVHARRVELINQRLERIAAGNSGEYDALVLWSIERARQWLESWKTEALKRGNTEQFPHISDETIRAIVIEAIQLWADKYRYSKVPAHRQPEEFLLHIMKEISQRL